ncbi:autorepressor SdpR family transcription factor [Oceanicaulis sp. MMSF_3324]|uniref:autorepressor SdpR family transcription factor n=1 Tax=Oceanicaulis sp. MMSF_3324 TaxID=3046702 RepID=UPI00273F7B51|nr:autorepressor SdpR family transcription factor [Oceanicaulis sp. MMSF_3324]
MSDAFSALAHPVRREVLRLLRDGPMTAGALADRFDVAKPTMSRHFATLREAGLIQSEKAGNQIRYRLNVSVAEDLMALMMDLLNPSGSEKGDLK